MSHNFVGHRGIFFFRSFDNQKNMSPYFWKLHNLHETVDDKTRLYIKKNSWKDYYNKC